MSEHLNILPDRVLFGSNGTRLECYHIEKDNQPYYKFNFIKDDKPLETFEIGERKKLEHFALALIRAATVLK